MKRTLPLLALLVLSCGGEPATGVGLPLVLELKGVFSPAEAGAIQITVVAHGDQYVCEELRRTCLKKQIDDGLVDRGDLVPLRDGEDGAEKPSFRRMLAGGLASLESSDGQTFDVVLPPGKNYLVMVEVLSADGPSLKASGCALLPDVVEGDNPPVLVAPVVVSGGACDPRID